MRYKRPTTMDRFFKTPAHQRPDIDLGLSATPYVLPAALRDIDIGPTRWFDMVYGFALDGAQAQNLPPQTVNAALVAGDLVVRTSFFDTAVLTKEASVGIGNAAFVGTVQAVDDSLIISAGAPTDMPHALLYQRQGDGYSPYAAQLIRRQSESATPVPEMISLPEPYIYDETMSEAPLDTLPPELWVAHYMGGLADAANFYVDTGSMAARGEVTAIGPVAPPGRG